MVWKPIDVGDTFMLLRVVRRLSLDEVVKRIKEFESRLGASFLEFEKRFTEGRLDPGLFGEYVEWADLVHAYEAYVESGELDYASDEVIDLRDRDFERLLTHKRIELLVALASSRVESINELARRVKRSVKNVHGDLKILERLGFVQLRKLGKRNIAPEVLVKEIGFLIQ